MNTIKQFIETGLEIAIFSLFILSIIVIWLTIIYDEYLYLVIAILLLVMRIDLKLERKK